MSFIRYNGDLTLEGNPIVECPTSALMTRLVSLLIEAFPDVPRCRDSFTFDSCKRPRINTVYFTLHRRPLRALKFAMSEEATTAMLIVEDCNPGPKSWADTIEPERRSLEREVLANDCWDAFVGWVSFAKMIYERDWKVSSGV